MSTVTTPAGNFEAFLYSNRIGTLHVSREAREGEGEPAYRAEWREMVARLAELGFAPFLNVGDDAYEGAMIHGVDTDGGLLIPLAALR